MHSSCGIEKYHYQANSILRAIRASSSRCTALLMGSALHISCINFVSIYDSSIASKHSLHSQSSQLELRTSLKKASHSLLGLLWDKQENVSFGCNVPKNRVPQAARPTNSSHEFCMLRFSGLFTRPLFLRCSQDVRKGHKGPCFIDLKISLFR